MSWLALPVRVQHRDCSLMTVRVPAKRQKNSPTYFSASPSSDPRSISVRGPDIVTPMSWPVVSDSAQHRDGSLTTVRVPAKREKNSPTYFRRSACKSPISMERR